MQIELVQVFVQVVKNGSFTRAAETLRVPKSTVSKAISRLESETGTKLLIRTTRSQTLTAAGKVFYDSCVGPIQAIEDAQKSLSGNDSMLNGTLKITAPEDLGTDVIAPACGRLTLKHSGLNFELNYTDQLLDLVKDGYDLAIRIGYLKESGLKSRKVGEIKTFARRFAGLLEVFWKNHEARNLEGLPMSQSHRSPRAVAPALDFGRHSSTPGAAQNPQQSYVQFDTSGLCGSGSGLGAGLLGATVFRERRTCARVAKLAIARDARSDAVTASVSASARLRLVSDDLMEKLRMALEV